MNRQITHLFTLFVLMFVVLVGFSSWWSVIRADELEDNTANRRPLLEEQRIPRGIIFASDGRTRLAESVPVGEGGARRFVRAYPEGSLFAHAIGYSFVERGRSGLEKSRNDELVGRTDEFDTLIEEITGGVAKEETMCAPRSIPRPSVRRSPRWPGGRARSWPSSRRPAAYA